MNRDENLELIYEGMFLLEGAKETLSWLKSKGIDDVVANKLIEIDTTPSKRDAMKLGSYFIETNNIKNIETYYKKFLRLKETGKIKDINTLKTFADLEKFVDEQEKKTGNINIEGEKTSEQLLQERIYGDNNLDIWHADNVKKACDYGHKLGQSYSFCISRAGGGNMFGGYRLRMESSFYFILFKNRSKKIIDGKFEDPSHMIVLDVQPNKRLQWTWADNGAQGHGTKDTTWEEVFTECPELKPAYEKGVFKEFKLSPQEENKIERFQRIANYDDWNEFFNLNQDEKVEYITSGYELNTEVFEKLDPNLRNEYINMGHQLNDTFFELLTPKEKERWEKTRLVVIQQAIEEGGIF